MQVLVHKTNKLELIKSTKGKDKVIYNGYAYVKQQEKNGRIRWVCNKRNNGCSGAVVPNNDLYDPCLTKPLTHAMDMIGVHAAKKRAEMAVQSIAPPSAILAAVIRNTDDDIISRMGTAEVCARSMLRARRRIFPAEPDDLANLVVPELLVSINAIFYYTTTVLEIELIAESLFLQQNKNFVC